MSDSIWQLFLSTGARSAKGCLVRKAHRPRPRSRVRLEELEPRLAPASYAVNAQLNVVRLDNQGDTPGENHAVVFFEAAVADYQILRQGLGAGTDAVVLDSAGDGLHEMAAFLAGRHDLTALSLVAHGSPGAVMVGTATLAAGSLGNYGPDLAVLGSALGHGGELDLWVCDSAAGSGGDSLVSGLASATGAGVAAADHLIGSGAQGGNWQLNVCTAGARGAVPFSAAALEAFPGLLATWTPSASMATARSGQTATLLQSGKVLVTGGFNGVYLAGAELYDPVSKNWSSVGTMATPRYGHTATLLKNGQVLVAGGINKNGALSSAELYDPATNSWSSAGALSTGREQQTATLLPSGQVLVTGGIRNGGSILASAELYDPVANSWSAAATLGNARSQHTATLLGSGQVLVTAGIDSDFNPLASAELYDPITNTWSATAGLATARYWHSATLLASGQVLVTGGLDNTFNSVASAELYDPASNTWSSAGLLAIARNQHTATLLADGRVLVAGGFGIDTISLSSAELYDPSTGAWSAAVSLNTARAIHTATLLSDGQVLAAGGDRNGSFLSSTELYNPAGVPNPLLPTVTVTDPGGVYNGAPFEAASFVLGANNTLLASFGDPAVSYTYFVGPTASGTGSTTAPTNVGTYTVVAHWTSNNPNYLSADSAPETFTITPAPITVAADAQSKPFGAADPALTYHITQGTLAAGDSFSGALSRVPGENPGSYAIQQGTLALGGNYALTFVGANLTVTPATRLVVTNLSTTNLTAGKTLTLTVAAQDSNGRTVPGYTGTVQLSSSDSQASINGSALPATYTFVASDAGSHTFTVKLETPGSQTITVTDQADKGLTAISSPVKVVLPFSQYVVSVLGGNSATAGNAFLIRVQAADRLGMPVSNYDGPASVDIATTPFDPQGNLPTTITLDSNGFGFFLGTLKTAGSYTLTATAGSFTGKTNITIVPASAALFKVATPVTTPTGRPFNITVTALDAFGNVAAGYGGKVHFTSTDAHAVLPADSTLPGGTAVFTVTLNTGGDQTITVTDKATSPAITGTSSGISPPLAITAFTPTATGFKADFNKAFNPAKLSLYGIGTHTVASVTLVGAHVGPVTGSLIIDPSDTSITFNATANSLFLLNDFGSVVLPDDTYTVTLVSNPGSNGFLDALGLGLGGANTGKANYTATFATHYQANATPVLAIPDFARGPDEAHTINVPNDSAHGIPITLYNAVNVTDVTFVLNYNPSLLTVTAGLGGAGSDATDPASSFTIVASPTLIDSTHAQARFHFQGGNPQSGTVVLGDVVATVPNSAASVYRAKELLELGSIVVNHGTIPGTVAANGIHVNAYFGDVTGNGTIDGLDLATAINVAQGKDTGFAAYRLLDPAIVGDVANDFSVDAGAISTMAAFIVHLPTAGMPLIPTGLTVTPVDPNVSP